MWCMLCCVSDARGEGLPGPSSCPWTPHPPGKPQREELPAWTPRRCGSGWCWDTGFPAPRQRVDLERLFPVPSSLKSGSWSQALERLE